MGIGGACQTELQSRRHSPLATDRLPPLRPRPLPFLAGCLRRRPPGAAPRHRDACNLRRLRSDQPGVCAVLHLHQQGPL